jgi:hypothetical protein
MEDRKQRRPLLEEDVDHLVGDQPRRCVERDDALRVGRSCFRSRAEEGIRVNVGRQSACLLCLLLESLCRTLGSYIM